MKVKLQGKGEEVSLGKTEYVTEGGEGQIYKKNGTIFKIYTDLSKMVPEGKIKELQELTSCGNIIVPLDILLNEKGKVIGFTMKEASDSSPLCQLFTTSFRERSGITEQSTMNLVEAIQKGIEFVHSKDCLIVDVNELNFLVDNKNFTYPWFIDTNSYKTRSFPPTAIMPSIRDYSTSDFTRLTDWYSFSILAFQLFIGIHPYKGKHPDYAGKDLVERMKKGISVFDPKVSVPKATRDYSCIPSEYMKWFKTLYADGKRTPPPSVSGVLTVVQVVASVVSGTDKFIIKLEREYDNTVLGFKVLYGNKIVLTANNKVYIGKTGYDINRKSSVVASPKSGTLVAASIKDGILELINITSGKEITGCEIQAEDIMAVDSTLYVKSHGRLIEVLFTELNYLMASPRKVADIMEQSSIMFPGCVYQNILGQAWFAIPTPGLGVYVLHIPELDGHRVLDAKYLKNVLMVSSFKNNRYYKSILRFDSKNSYKIRMSEDSSIFGINFTVLDNGLVVSITEDGELEMFTNSVTSDKVSIIQDPEILSDMTLCKNGQEVLFFKGNKLCSLKTK